MVDFEKVILRGGPFDGVAVHRPAGRWTRIQLTEGDGEPGCIIQRYRPKRDGSYVYDGPDTVRFVLPGLGGGAA
jgi:hypothetical protein